MSDLKQVKVDNWGIYFLQRLKHFFNRTDYCDLTLQFQDNAQLKVHRLVLSACTEYFELLERTCEMYEDCLVMPDDLQADVVVPIVNFMYTGQLEFKVELLDKLYQTSQIMNMPVLSKLLDAQRLQIPKPPPAHSYGGVKHYAKGSAGKQKGPMPSTSTSKRSFSKAFETEIVREKHSNRPASSSTNNGGSYRASSPTENHYPGKRPVTVKGEPRPTRYELPEELDTDNIYDTSFTDISYTSAPLMVHPETTKRYISKKGQYSVPSSSKRFVQGPSTVEIVECRKASKEESMYEEDSMLEDTDMFGRDLLGSEPVQKNTNQLFDQILDNNTGPKVTIEAKSNKQASKLDHAKIISEVLKKYPHLVKSNKNIKLKLLDTPSTNKPMKKRSMTQQIMPKEDVKIKSEPDYTYETEVLDSVKAAKLIALGAENIKGPWICLICGTPGRALHFTSYFKFRRHLVEVHNEKPVSNMCEYCGLKSLKRNYLLHHLYTKHGQKPPPQYHFPKCNLCSYIALNEGYLIKHKMTHAETRNFRCNVCSAAFNSSSMLLLHIQNTGHKYSADRKTNLQCVYCLKVFLRESNLYAHLKTNHKQEAKTDCIIDDSDEERLGEETMERVEHKQFKYEIPVYDQESEEEMPYVIPQKPVIVEKPKKHRVVTSTPRQKILNSGFSAPIPATPPAPLPQKKPKPHAIQHQFMKDENIDMSSSAHDEIIMIGETEYIMRDNQLIPKNSKMLDNDQYILSDMLQPDVDDTLHTLTADSSLEFSNIHHQDIAEPDVKLNKKPVMNQPIQIVVSNEDEYKALMSTNHSIIFDDTDSSKRLTVLAGPHNSTLDGTTIDLDNTQSNEMMIIQDDYPMNVSEAVSADNNIVVVYSHPVGDQNKPYQLITSQALGGAQFVSTSAVLTRNYDAVTTSAGIVNNQIMDTGNWHDNIDHNIENQQMQVPQEPDLQVLTNVEEVVMAPTQNEIDSKLDELPEVHIIQEQQKDNINQESQIEHMEETLTQHSESTEMAVVDNTVEEVREVPSTVIPMEDVPVQTIGGIETMTMESEEQAVITLQTQDTEASMQNEVQEQIPAEIDDDGEDKFEETLGEQEVANGSAQNEAEAETENLQSQTFTQTEEEIPSQEPAEQDAHSFVPSKEQIQNLTSEWSEDDDETTHETDNVRDDNEKQNEVEDAENHSVELEESIENIQQEMEKQMTQIVSIEAIDECGRPTQEQINTVEEILEDAANNAAPPCPEKITSLLNDWEENDSQEDNENENETAEEITEAVKNTKEVESGDLAETEEDTSAEAPKKDDKIKSLVSDWDDEEEDGNKE